MLSTEPGRCTIAAVWFLLVLIRHADQRLDAHLKLCALCQSGAYLVAPQALLDVSAPYILPVSFGNLATPIHDLNPQV